MAAERYAVREAGFCVSRGAGDGVCGRVFLAWVPDPRDEAEDECGVLAEEDRAEQGAGPGGVPVFKEEGVEGCKGVGAWAGPQAGEAPSGALAADAGDVVTRCWMLDAGSKGRRVQISGFRV